MANADGATHALRPAPLNDLVDGYTYEVHRVNGSEITLRDVGGSTDKSLSFSYTGTGTVVGGDSHDSNQHLFKAGAPLQTSLSCSGACGQQVYLRLTGSLPSTTQKLLATDGSSLRGVSPPSGDGQTSASATGGGGAAIDVSVPTARVVVNPTVKSYVAASTVTVGGDFWVTSNLATNTRANTQNGSGGLVSIPDVDSSIVGDGDNSGVPGTHNNTSFVGADFGGDGISGDTAPGTSQVDASGITITAGGNVKLMATTFITSSIRAHTDSGGAGDFSNASALVRLDDNTTTIIGKNAHVTGSTVALISKTGGNNTGTADSFVLAFIGSSDDDMDFRLHSRANAILDGDTLSNGVITGTHGVDVRAYHENETWSYSGSYTCICFDFHIGHDVDTNVTLSDTSSGHQGVTVVAAPRIILCSSPADTNCHTRDPFYATPLDTSTGDTNLALYVQAEFGTNVNTSASTFNANRNIHWNSDVILNAGPSPLLIVGSDGTVQTSINIKVNGIWAPAPGDALTPSPSPVIEVDDLVNDDSGNVWMQSANGHIDGGVGTNVSPHWWGTFYYRDNWQTVTILNHSSRALVIDNIDPINRDTSLHPRVKENAPGGDLADAKFSIVRQVDPTLITITNDHASGPDLLINGFIDNPIGETDVTNQYGPISASTIRGGETYSPYTSHPPNTPHTSLIRSNVLHLYAGTSIGASDGCVYGETCASETNLCRTAAAPCVNVDLVWWASHPPVLTTYSGTNTYVDLKTLLRNSISAPASVPVIEIESMVALDSIYVVLRGTVYQTEPPEVPGINVQVNPDGGSYSSPPYYVTFFHPDGFRCDYPNPSVNCPTPYRELGAFATDAEKPYESTYDFQILDAGGNLAARGDVTVDAYDSSPSATRINIVAYVDVHGDGDVRSHTNGFVTITEKPRPGGPNHGDLRVDQIVSTDDDVTLNSPGAILDSDNDKLDANNGLPDVVGVNITMTAGNNLDLADPNHISGHGGVGVPQNFLEIIVNNVATTWGVLTITDTASERTGWNIDAMPPVDPGAATGTFGVFVTQSDKNMDVNRILTNGDASLVALNGSIRDGRSLGDGLNGSTDLPNVEANNIDLAAYCAIPNDATKCGNVGARAPPADPDDLTNDLKIDSGHGDTQHPSTTIVGRVGIETENDIYLTETDGALNVLVAQSLSGNVRLSVREHSGQGDDLNLLLPSHDGQHITDTIVPTQNDWAILIDYTGPTTPTALPTNAKRDIVVSNPATDGTIDSPSINAENGWILLRVGDNVTLGGLSTSNYPDAHLSGSPNALTDAQRIAQNTKVVAGKWIDVHGDYNIYSPSPDGGGQLDTGWGTVMHLHGTITPGPLTTSSPDCRDEINPGRDCNVTRIFGNVDTDTIVFDQTFLGGRTHVYGSVAMTCTGHSVAACTNPIPTIGGPVTAPAGDSEDFAFVNQLQTMDVNAGHTLTLDLQDGTDTYVVNTTGSQPCLGGDQISGSTCHNYVINVLDTGAPDRGSDVLIVNGIDAACSGYDPSDPNGTAQCPTDDIFLLRRSNYIGSYPGASPAQANEIADDPAFVALLHGNFGTVTPVGATTDIDLKLCYAEGEGCTIGQTLIADGNVFTAANGFLVGRRIHLGGGNSGVWAGDYTIQSVDSATRITLSEKLPTGVSLTTEQVPTSDVELTDVSIGILSGDVTTPDPSGNPTLRNQNYERINYDAAVNGRLIVNGLSGNDYFASDDNAAITTLDGGEGNDTFQIGQIFGLSRDAFAPPQGDGFGPPTGNTCDPRIPAGGVEALTYDTSCAGLNQQDVFGTVATTRGWLSAGASQPLVAVGDVGDDVFTVYSNQAPLRLEGGDDNDLFVVRGFALAQTKTNGGDPATGTDCDPDPNDPDCEIVWINAQDQIAMPRLTTGFSTAAESDIRTGSGTNQVEYNMNAPVSVDGGAGFDKLVILGTEYADHIVVTSGAIYGVGVWVTYARIEVLEIDALEGDDAIDVLSTAPGVATRVIGGLGNDTINVAGDVTGDVFALDIEGTSSTINHAVSSSDPLYNGLLAAGLDLSVARAGQGSIVITETGGFSAIYEGGCLGLPGSCTPVPAFDSYTVYLASKPVCAPGVSDGDCWVYVTVSVAYPPQSEHEQLTLGSIPDGPPEDSDCPSTDPVTCEGDTFLVTTDPWTTDPSDFLRQIQLNGVSKDVEKRSIVLAFNGLTYANPQNVYMYAVDDGRAEGTRVVTASHSVIQPTCDPSKPKNCFDGAVVRNVEVTVYDNDQPGVLITQIDPDTAQPGQREHGPRGLGHDSRRAERAPGHRGVRQVRDRAGDGARERSDRRRRPGAQRPRAGSDSRLPDEQRPAAARRPGEPLLLLGLVQRPDRLPAGPGHLHGQLHGRQLVRPGRRRAARAQRLRGGGSALEHDHAHDRHGADDGCRLPRLLGRRHEDDDPRAARRPRARRREPRRLGARERRQDARDGVRRRSVHGAGTGRQLQAPPHQPADVPGQDRAHHRRAGRRPAERDDDPARGGRRPPGGAGLQGQRRGRRLRADVHDHARERLRPRQLPRRGLREGSADPAQRHRRTDGRGRRLRDHRPRHPHADGEVGAAAARHDLGQRGERHVRRRHHQPAPQPRPLRGQRRLRPGRRRLRALHRRPDVRRDDHRDAQRRQLQRRRADGRDADQVQQRLRHLHDRRGRREGAHARVADAEPGPRPRRHDQQDHEHARPHRQRQLARRRLPRGPADQDRRRPGVRRRQRRRRVPLQDRADQRHGQEPDEQDLAHEHDAGERVQARRAERLGLGRARHDHAVGRGRDLRGADAGQPGADLPGQPDRQVRHLVPGRHRRPAGRPLLPARPRPLEPEDVRQAAAPAERHPRPARRRGWHDVGRPLRARGGRAAGRGQPGAVPGRAAAARVAADRHAQRLRRRQHGGPDGQADVDGAVRPQHGRRPRLHLPARPGQAASVRRARQVPRRHQLRLDQHRPGHARLHDGRDAVDDRDRQHHARRRQRPPVDRQHAPARRRLQPDHRRPRASSPTTAASRPCTAAATRCSRSTARSRRRRRRATRSARSSG